MADNTTLSTGSGGDTIATDDISGVKHQRVKIQYGDDGSATDVSDTNPLPVDDAGGSLSVDDGGGALTVDGTVTANLGATDTAALAAVETAVELLDDTVYTDGTGTPSKAIGVAGTDGTNPQIISTNSSGHVNIADGGNTITVDGTVAVTGVATAANQTTLIGHVDGVEGLLTTIDADTGSIASSATTLAGAVDGTEMQVDVVAALPAGTNNIGDVDVLSVVPGTGATNLGKAEDAAHTTGDTGVMSLAVRLDSGASLADTDGDYAPLQVDASGALRVTGGGGGTEYTVDAAAPAAPTGSTFVMERDDALAALTEVEGDWTNPRSNANGALWVKHDGTVTVDGSGVTQPVSGTVSVTGVATAANQTTIIGHVDGIEGLLTTIDGDTGTLAVTGGGTETGALRVTVANNSTGVLSVDDNGSTLSVDDGGSSLTVDNGGTFVVQDNQVVTDNGGFTDGTTKVFVSGYVYDEVAGTALTENDAGAARMNVNRAQVGIIEDGTTRGRYATVSASNALKTDGSAVTQPVSYATTGSGTATGALRVELPTNGTGVIATVGAVTAITNALPAGSNAIGKLAANSGVDIGDVDVTTVGTITPGTGATSLGKAIDSAIGATDTGVAALAVRDDVLTTLTPADSDYTHMRVNSRGAQWAQLDAAPTGSGVLIAKNIDVDESEDAIKASAGTMWGYFVANLHASSYRYVKLYNATVASVVVGTTTPVLTLPIPPGVSGHVPWPHGVPFDTAITVAATTGIADNDTGAPGANEVVFHGFYT